MNRIEGYDDFLKGLSDAICCPVCGGIHPAGHRDTELEGIIKRAREHLKMTIDSLEEGRPQITHSYYVACLHAKLNDLDFILKGLKAQAQSEFCTKGD